MSDVSTPPIVEVMLPAASPSKGEREYKAFLCLLPGLLSAHRGRYVAVHEGEVVDADEDDIELVRRVHARVGYVPIHVGLVTDEPRAVRLPHYRDMVRAALGEHEAHVLLGRDVLNSHRILLDGPQLALEIG